MERVRNKLGIEPGETTECGRITCLAMECLGSCDTAPVALVNETLHENLDEATMDRLIDQAMKTQPESAAHHT
jgi:NADH:ubiquinone oxidoreductase subunit E